MAITRDRWKPTAWALLAAAALGCGLLIAVAFAAGDSTGAQTPARGSSIQDSPGYYPPADPESASVRIGRRMNAPPVRKAFTGGAASMKALGESICTILERTPRLDSLMALTIQEDEFGEILWPEFPQSRPATGLTAEDAWRVLYPRLLNGCNSALVDHASGYFEFLRFETDSVMRYKNFKLHSGVTLVARNAAGGEEHMGWIRVVAERNGRFKIYSVRD